MDQVTFIEKVAQKISGSGLTVPAILFLEAHKPLAFLSSQLLLIAQPTLNLFVSPYSTQSMVDLLADSTQLEQLMTQLEQKASPKNRPPTADRRPPKNIFMIDSLTQAHDSSPGLDPLETPLHRPGVQNAK
jgi:hypothetical protein